MSVPIFAALCRRVSPNTSRIRLLLGSVLLAASLNVAQASALLRKYIILEDALTHVDEAAAALKGGSVQERTKDLPHLIVLWTPSAGTREAPTSAEVYLGYPTTHIDAAAMHNPAILIIGENDTSVRINAIMGLFAANRPDNAPWALAVEPNIAHGFGRTAHLWLPFLEWAVQARLPCAPAAPGDGSSPAGLAIIDPATGFVVAHRALKGGEEPIMPAASFKGALDETSWLPNEMLAMAFLAFNTPRSDLDLTMEPASGVLHANDRLRLGIARFDPHAWKQVRLLVNGRVVASLSPEEPEVTIGVSRPGIYCAVAVGAPSAGGPLRLAGPLSWIVGPSDR